MDFEPHSSPESLGEEADLSVVGTVRSIDDGRVFGGGDEPEFPNVTLTVRVDKVLAGDQSLVTDGEVFVELPRSARGTAKQLQDTMPVDQEVILFLDDYSSGMGTFAVTQEASSVPDGAPIFAPYADGILLEDTETGKIVGGYVPLDELDTPWRSGIGSIDEFVAEHFSGV